MNSPSSTRRKFVGMTVGATAAAALAPVTANAQGGGAEKPKYGIVGRPAPELLVDYWIDGAGEPTSVNLAAERGRWVFMKFFQAWCPGCHASGFPALQEVATAFADEPRVTVLGLQTTFEGFGTNTRKRVREMQLRYELDIPMGHDEGVSDGVHLPTTMLNYRTGGTPWIVLVAPDGTVVYNEFHVSAPRLIEYIREDLTKA